MSNDLVVTNYQELCSVSKAMANSGYFPDASQVAQAIVKIQAGMELGLPPFAAMSSVNIIQGKPTLAANAQASLVKKHPNYNYRVKKCDNSSCVITWFEKNGHEMEEVGESSFTIDEAKQAGLAGRGNWSKYTSDMLFARALTRGVKRYAPDIFGGAPVYDPDEMAQFNAAEKPVYNSPKKSEQIISADVDTIDVELVDTKQEKLPISQPDLSCQKPKSDPGLEHKKAVMQLMSDEGIESNSDKKLCAEYLKSVGFDISDALDEIMASKELKEQLYRKIREFKQISEKNKEANKDD